LFILLKNSRIQDYLAQIVTRELSEKLDAKVSVGTIEYKLFNSISINELYVEDLHRDTLLYVHEANAHFHFWKFFRGVVSFTSIDFNRLHGNIVIDSMGQSNLDFIIKAFEKPHTNDSSQVEYRIERFGIVNSSFNFTNHQVDSLLNPELFNASRLKLRDVNAIVSLDVFNKDTLSARIQKLSAVEQSGLTLVNLNTQILGSRTGVQLPVVNMQLPNSRILFEDVRIRYDSLADFKHLAERLKLNAPLKVANIALSDLAAFIPELKHTKGVASVKGLLSGRISSFRMQQLEVTYGKTFMLQADLDVSGLPNLDEAFIYGQINDLHFDKSDLQDFLSDISRKPFLLPKELNTLGLIRYKGNVTGFLSNLVAYGNLNTNLGSVSTDILLQLSNDFKNLTYNGTIKSGNFQLGKLLNNKQLGKIAFNFNTKGTKKENASLKGELKAKVPELQFNNYTYRDIQLTGKYDGTGFDGTVDVEDENINAHFLGVIDLTKKLPVFDFELKVSDTNLYALNLIKQYPGATFSFNGKTNMVGNSPDNINGYVKFDSILVTNKNKTLNVSDIQFVSRIENDFTHFAISSDFINGAFSGNFKYSTIGYTIGRIVQKYLPALAGTAPTSTQKYSNHINVDLRISNTRDISEVLEIPYQLEGISTIKGFIDDNSNQLDVSVNIPTVTLQKQRFENISFNFESQKQKLQVTSRAQMHEKDGLINVFLIASAAKDSVTTQLGWQNSQEVTNAGEVQAVAKLRNEEGKLSARISVLPTQVIISDSIWNIHPCKIDINPDSTINIHNFRFDNQQQFIHINGIASAHQRDSLLVQLNEINLDFVMRLLRLQGISIGGIATGKANIFSLFDQPIFEADLFVKSVKLNHKLVGDAQVYSVWDKVNKHVVANGIFVDSNNSKDTIALASGVFVPKADSLDFVFDARKLSIEFLTPYFDEVVQNVKGFGSGKVRMFGPSKTLWFEGNAYIDKGQASVDMLKTTYYFNDSIRLTPKTIEFRNVKIYDQERNQGTLNALLKHNGLFREMDYDANIVGRNILAMNTRSEDNDYFFGKAYANGTVRIFGDEKEANIVVNAVSQPNTKCYIQMGGASNASDNSFINFVNKKNVSSEGIVEVRKPESNFNVKVNLQIEVTPDAEMELIIDPKAGDVITGKGNGNLRVEFDSFSDIKLFGTYIINSGNYLFTLQNVIRKEFRIDRGSTIAWTGDPFNAQVNIRALYPLTASLRDLMDESQLSSMSRSSVPVNCVLKLTDNLLKPTIHFDIDLPSSDEVVKQQVRGIINTEEMMNRQILYLLVFNKFYTPEFVRTSTTGINLGASEGISLLTSTVSAQFNTLISKMFNTSNLSFGFDYRQSDELSSDVQAQILYQPSNRLVVNGNIGYRNDNVNTNTNKFIGDLDVEWFLTESGKLRFKFYNHTIDRYQLRTNARTTQGLGLMYKEDFESVSELLNYYWRWLSGIGKKKNSDESNAKND
jgi:hypothetical protein